jgi:hypothetical protein
LQLKRSAEDRNSFENPLKGFGQNRVISTGGGYGCLETHDELAQIGSAVEFG